jgi:gluconokinase
VRNGSPIAPADAQGPLILTIDIGTSSVRALLYDRQARLINGIGAQEGYEVRSAADGSSVDDPDEALARIWRCLDATLAQAGRLAEQIGAVALDTLVSNIMAIDASGRQLTPLITYADTRNAADAEALRRELDERAVHQRTGCLLRTSYWPARLAWFRRTQPDVWRHAARWITIGEYLELKLFGEARASYSVASWSGLLDRHALAWDAPLLDHLGLTPAQFSPLADVDAPLRGLRGRDHDGRAYAERWPALRDVPWFPAIGDGAAANIGSGAISPDRIALTVGTTGALRVMQPEVAEVPPGLWCYRVDRRHALLGGATSEGGNVYAWLRETLNLGAPDAIEQALAALPPDGHGITVLPFLAGERSPGWAGDVRATIHGLGLNTRPIEILRASLEAIAYRFALIAEALFQDERRKTKDEKTADFSQSPSSSVLRPSSDTAMFIASGGALLNSPAWIQIIAAALGRPVVASEEREATSRGVALLALESLGTIRSLDELPAADGTVYQPNMAHHTIYQAAIQRQRQLYERFYGKQEAVSSKQ